jgi:hypothetical protein
MPEDIVRKTFVDSLRAVWALVRRVGGGLDELSVPNWQSCDGEGWVLIEWREKPAERANCRPKSDKRTLSEDILNAESGRRW